MQAYSLATVGALVVCLGAACCWAQVQSQEQPVQQSPCNWVKCGYGARCELDKYGNPRCVCPSICPAIYQPVCGSDGVTYGNTCRMNVASCEKKRQIIKRYNGPCDSESATSPPLLPTRISPGLGLPKFRCPTAKPVVSPSIAEGEPNPSAPSTTEAAPEKPEKPVESEAGGEQPEAEEEKPAEPAETPAPAPVEE